jgi:hypothetical protein
MLGHASDGLRRQFADDGERKECVMSALRRMFLLGLFATACLLVPAGQALAGTSCDKVDAKGVGEQRDGGRWTADIKGDGVLSGTSEGQFELTGVDGADLSFKGDVKFDTGNGTLTATVDGSFDLSSGKFSASGPVTDSSGDLSDATGDLELKGIEDLRDGSFVADVTGEICVKDTT